MQPCMVHLLVYLVYTVVSSKGRHKQGRAHLNPALWSMWLTGGLGRYGVLVHHPVPSPGYVPM